MFENETHPLVSVITPVYNGAYCVGELIESVLEQDYPRIEHIVIDDGSTDGGATQAVLQRYPHLRWWSRPNKGQYATMNEGLLAAQGSVFTCICADDWYHNKRAISTAMDLWRQRPSYDGICGKCIRVDSHRQRLPGQARRWRWPKSVIFYHNYLPHSNLFVDRKVLVEANLLFDPTFRYCGDREWASRLYLHGLQFYFTSEVLVDYRCHEAQASASGGGRNARGEWPRLIAKHGKSKAMAILVNTIRRVQFRGSIIYESLQMKARARRRSTALRPGAPSCDQGASG